MSSRRMNWTTTKRPGRWPGGMPLMLATIMAAAYGSVTPSPPTPPSPPKATPSVAISRGPNLLDRAREWLAKPASPAHRAEAARCLRRVVIEKSDEEAFEAILLLGEMRKPIRQRFPGITAEELAEAQDSVGIALCLKDGDRDVAIATAVEEAWLLCAPAQQWLEILYEHRVGAIPKHDKRILAFFRESAREGLPRSQRFYGRILLEGMGVEADPEEGRRLLEQSNLAVAYNDLARY